MSSTTTIETVHLPMSAINRGWQKRDHIIDSRLLQEITTTTDGLTFMWPAIPLPAFCSTTITMGHSVRLLFAPVSPTTRKESNKPAWGPIQQIPTATDG